jgi:hypothetical protein
MSATCPNALAAAPEAAVYGDRIRGAGTRGWMELVGALHRAGYGRLRLACSWEHAGPAPVWFGDVLSVAYFSTVHGAVLVTNPEAERRSGEPTSALMPNALPMFSSRRCRTPDYPWIGFGAQTPDEAAAEWVRLYPTFADAGRGSDPLYEAWYAAMLVATAPTGLIAVAPFLKPPGPRMYVSCGPPGVSDFERPPPGEFVSGPEPLPAPPVAPPVAPPPAPPVAPRPWWKFW